MSRPINVSDTLTFNPTNYSDNEFGSSYSTGVTNACASTDNSSSYARFTMRNTSYSIYYDFSVSGIPSSATITSVTCAVKGYVQRTNYYPSIQLYSGTTAKGSSSTITSTSSGNITNLTTTGTWTVSELSSAKLYIKCASASTNNNRYFYFYGADLAVTYSISGTEYEITSTLATDAVDSINPEGQTYVLEGNDYELSIYASSIDDIIVEDNGTDVTNSLVQHQSSQGGTESTVLGTYTLVSGSFNGSGASYFQGLVGKGVDSTTTTSNYYSGGSGTIAVFTYNILFNNIPSNATITRLYLEVNGHAESTSNSNEYMCVQLLNGSTSISDELNFKSIGTSNSTQTIEATTLPTVAQLNNLKVQCRLGYYGGAINGATCYVEYTTPATSLYYWTYTLTNIQEDHNIEIGDNAAVIKYLINTSIHTNECSVNNASIKQKEGTNFTLIIYYSDINNLIITDNGNNINSLITGSSGEYYYAITNLSADHYIIINEKPWYEVTTESLYSSTTVSSSSYKVYEGGSFTVTVNISNISLIVIKDKGIDVTSQFTIISSGVYRASYSNVNEDHEFIVIEANSYSINSVSNTLNAEISPSGISSISEGSSITFTITTDLSSDLLILKDNETDVTENLVYHQGSNTISDTSTFIPSSFDSVNSTYDSIYSGTAESGLTAHTDSNRFCVYSNTGANAESYLYYNFDCSNIPANAIITSITCIAAASCYSSGSYFSTKELQLCSGTTPKGTATTITGNGSTSANHTINGGSWTRNELNNIKLRLKIVRGTSSPSEQASFSFWGATLTVNYEVGSDGYYQYTLTNINKDHTVALYEVFIPEEEDPQKTYYSISISSINATTNPANGTVRVEEGDDQTIVIIPSESQLTLATDNGVDISDRITGGTNTYDITTQVSGASYGFELNNNDYYESTNNGVNKSASVARINFHMKTRCLVTIEYINYAEDNYDYGMFGKIDTAVATDGLTASSGSSSPSDSISNYQLAMASNSSSAQTITYTIEKGEHFVDIKYGKDDATDDNNDSLQWKISSIEALESTDLTYTINNIDEDHSLIFVFGNVVYYTVSASGNGCTTYPTGDFVVLSNNGYSITIIPEYDNYTFEIYDNGRNVSKSAEFFETARTNYYIYSIKKVNIDHIISIIFTEKTNSLYVKINGTYIRMSKAYKKLSGSWVEQTNVESIFVNNKIYVRGN